MPRPWSNPRAGWRTPSPGSPGHRLWNELRGIEGEGANVYFGAFDALITAQEPSFRFATRSRRPPLDPVNCLLSFLYTLLMHDARSALEGGGP